MMNWINNTLVFILFVIVAHLLLSQMNGKSLSYSYNKVPPPPSQIKEEKEKLFENDIYNMTTSEESFDSESPLEKFLREGDTLLM